jgi:hypothetical protein
MIRLIAIASLFLSTAAFGHDAPTGWSYPFSCCSTNDCREVSDASVKETAAGYIASNGETIPYTDKRIRNSPDGKFHLCTVAGEENTRAICLFVPPRSF